MTLILYIDGGARGNPGPAGAGVSIRDEEGKPFFEAAYFLGHQTNNAAEYLALIRALQRVEHQRTHRILIHSDSELLVRQLTGEYRVKSPKLAQLHEQAQLLLLRMPGWTVQHVPREENRRADELANLAMDRRRDMIVFDAERKINQPVTETVEPPVAQSSDSDLHAASSGDQEALVAPLPPGAKAARVTIVRQPKTGACPAESCSPQTFSVVNVLPAGLCIHAAHALLPTIIALLNTDPSEYAAIPTMTVRCMKPGCGALFHVAPLLGDNGVNHAEK